MTGKEAYEFWCRKVHDKDHDGRPLPSWEKLGHVWQEAWTAMGSKIAEHGGITVSTLPDGPPDGG